MPPIPVTVKPTLIPPPLPPPNPIQPALVQNNFNQTPKTTINLLNDFYERHLLNQTKFEQKLPLLHAGIQIPPPPIKSLIDESSAASSVSSSSLQKYNLNHHQIIVNHTKKHHSNNEKIEFYNSSKNFNINLISDSHSNRSQLQYPFRCQYDENSIGYINGKHFGSTSIPISILSSASIQMPAPMNMTSSSHAVATTKKYEMNDDCNGAKFTIQKEGKIRNGGDNNIIELGMIDALKYRRRNVSCDNNNKDEKFTRRVTPIGGNLSDRDYNEGNSKNSSGIMHNKSSNNYYQPTGFNTGTEINDLASKSIPDGNGCVDVEYRNSKINLMVETAQAISAAAYFARYVMFILHFYHSIALNIFT